LHGGRLVGREDADIILRVRWRPQNGDQQG
jgi:hypothetical protein